MAFHVLLDYIFSLERYVFNFFAHFLIESFDFCWIVEILYVFCVSVPYQICDLQVFSPILWVAFVSFDM